ncbi:large-conductance mechanosensitive channel protein MscL [Psychroflexus aestuariivivens]|uniref:large-conductance mechanosensitive channel protein MscL n=1 Tax=Psychroflexus aestuariivivens TaxID=1795040 RepID=UPI000FD9F05A|nr:large-conductance mechanosensitive channel protein MscL [Psychroflexus aestuariivivens]
MKIIKEFKEFAIKGNMFDMAIGIIIGTAFGKVVSSLVNDMIMPLIGYFLGRVKFQNLKLTLQERIETNGEVVQELVSVNYGNFIQIIIDFVVIALSIFVVIKIFNRMKNKAENESDQTETTPKNIELLAEIRDLLRENKRS